MAKGLYFYKLVSPYSEDVTKDCKLTVNEIDSNFINLKNVDIKTMHVDEEKKELILTRNDGETLVVELKEIIPSLEIDYDSVDGVINIEHDNQKYLIKDLITKNNLSKEILTKVYSDSTLRGIGTSKKPLSVAAVEKTGTYKPVLSIIDTTVNDRLPMHHNAKGDRYVVLEEVSDYGLLYNFDGVKHLNKLLEKTGWRVPTKEDWDSMLNAIEPCEYRNHNSTINNQVLGKYAGALLKSTEDWRSPSYDCVLDGKPHHHHHCNCDCEDFDVDFVEPDNCCKHPHEKPVKFKGFDAYGMNILPAGYAYYACPMQYQHFGYQGAFWSSESMYDSDVYTKVFDAKDGGVMQVGERPSAFLSIRLVKDYDGSNHKGVENILGQNYKTVLMPSLNNPNGYAIWTAQNLNIKERHLETVIPNAGLGFEKRRVYFIHEWNGFDWDKIEMSEGDSVVVLDKEKHNESYRIINGVLTNVTQHILDTLRGEMKDEMDIIKSRLDVAEETITVHTNRLDAIDELIESLGTNSADHAERISKLEEDLNTEILKRQEEVARLDERIDNEESKRSEEIARLDERVDLETESRKNRDNELQESIDSESTTRAEEDSKLWDALNVETESRKTAVEALQEQVDAEVAKRAEDDQKLWEGIATEQESRQKRDEELQNAIDSEISKRKEDVEELYEALTQETNSRTNRDEELQASIDTEVESRKNAITALQEQVDAEVEARKNRDNELQDIIDAEIEKRGQDVQDLYATIDAEQDSRKKRDEELQASIDAEVESRINKDNELQESIEEVDGKVNSEIERALDAEHTLKVNHDALKEDVEAHKLIGGDEGCLFNEETGELILKAKNPENDVVIPFSFDFGGC